MNETPNLPAPRKDPNDHTIAVIIATLIISLTCIISCAAVLIVLILRTAH
jgi:hypothetical protein